MHHLNLAVTTYLRHADRAAGVYSVRRSMCRDRRSQITPAAVLLHGHYGTLPETYTKLTSALAAREGWRRNRLDCRC